MARSPATIETVPRLSWTEISSHIGSRWKPGEHFSVVAQTGYGKSHLIGELLRLWRYTIVLDYKGDDETLTRDDSHRAVRRFPTAAELILSEETRFRIAPGGTKRNKRVAFEDAIRRAWSAGTAKGAKGGWTIVLDEARLICDRKYCGLEDHADAVWISGRSKGLTLIAGTQSPRFVPSSFYDQPRWLALGRIRDKRTLRRMAEIGGDTEMLMQVLPTLAEPTDTDPGGEFLFIGPRWSAIGKVGA